MKSFDLVLSTIVSQKKSLTRSMNSTMLLFSVLNSFCVITFSMLHFQSTNL